MGYQLTRRVHVAPFGVERDRIVRPLAEYSADKVVLIDYLSQPVPARPDLSELTDDLEENDIDHECRDETITDIFDALAVVGGAIIDHADDEVFVNLATGSKPVAIGAMIACMTTGARPYYVQAAQYGSHQGPVPAGVRSIDAVPPYPIDRPADQHLRVMEYIVTSDRTTPDGEPYRIKRELIEFGEREALPFMAEYTGDSEKGKFRRLDAHVVSPLVDQGFVRVEEVGTQRRVFVTEDGRNTLRAFRYCLP